MPRVTDYLDEFMYELRHDLLKGEAKWGDEWLYRSREGQEKRIINTIIDYYFNWQKRGGDFPWLAVAGNAMIAWIRDNFKYLSREWK